MSNKHILFSLLLLSFLWMAQTSTSEPKPKQNDSQMAEAWVDSVFNAMSAEERIGQLFMIRAHSDLGPEHVESVKRQILQYHVGGMCFFQGTPEGHAKLINEYQVLSKRVPIMVAIDGEWGLGMRLKRSTISFPRQLTLGAIQDNRLLYDMGAEVARQLRRLGIHINFAPVVDVNNNPDNPVINTRSFGEDRYNVAVKSYMYMKGMQDNGVMACAKHFPGHGDTDVDSHYDLPVINHQRDRLDSIELFPFRVLAEQNVGSMMVAHLQVPALDSTPNLPTTLSKYTVTDLLQDSIGFEGLIFTDGLEMKGVTKYHEPGQLEVKALAAGNDILLLPENIGASFNAIKAALQDGTLSQADIDRKVKKVLRAKYELGLTELQQIEMEGLRDDLNAPSGVVLKRKLLQQSLTLVRNTDKMIPFQEIDTLDLASLSIGAQNRTIFQNTLEKYKDITHYQLEMAMTERRARRMIDNLKNHEAVVVSLHDMSSYASKDYGFTSEMKGFLQSLNREVPVILVVFGTPYSLKYFDEFERILVAYTDDPMAQELAAQALFGAFSIKGRLPVTASSRSAFNTGFITSSLFRMGFGLPEEVGLNAAKLAKIDTIAWNGIDSGAMPGCVVLVAKDGKVIFHKAYGFHTYEKKRPVSPDDIFDLASITKIAASTLSIMKLQDMGLVNIQDTLVKYLPETDSTNKRDMVLADIMSHRAGLVAWIPFYTKTLTRRKKPDSDFYKKRKTAGYTLPVARSLYMQNDYADTIWQRILRSNLRGNKNYRYSDLGFYLMAEIVKRQSGKLIDEFARDNFYQPLGLRSMTYNPWQKYDKSRIPPTEVDRYFRWQTVHGYVHDMGAAMLGGVSGHAGLFGNAEDLAVLMQMLLNKGYYGGAWHLDPKTVREFTRRCPDCTRRGIGFDMKQLDEGSSLNLSGRASESTFGHLGFTGTCAWADPEQNLVYIFLSNRTYPSMKNNKFGKMDIRPRIQSAIYQALEN